MSEMKFRHRKIPRPIGHFNQPIDRAMCAVVAHQVTNRERQAEIGRISGEKPQDWVLRRQRVEPDPLSIIR